MCRYKSTKNKILLRFEKCRELTLDFWELYNSSPIAYKFLMLWFEKTSNFVIAFRPNWMVIQPWFFHFHFRVLQVWIRVIVSEFMENAIDSDKNIYEGCNSHSFFFLFFFFGNNLDNTRHLLNKSQEPSQEDIVS